MVKKINEERQNYIQFSRDLEKLGLTSDKVVNADFVDYLEEFAYSFEYHSKNLTNTQYAMIDDLLYLVKKMGW